MINIATITNKLKLNLQKVENKSLLSNFISLTILQGANYILPFITLPYLVRVLGSEKFGLIMFAQAFIMYFNILTDYGFNLSATREIAIHRENKEKISEIFSSVMIIKLGLLIISLIIMSVIVFSFEKFRKDWIIYYLTFGMVVGQVLFPVWFFQGMEKMKYITFLNITAKFIFTISIFIFVHKVSDYIYVPLINSLGFIVAGVLALWIVWKDFNINVFFPKVNSILSIFKDSSQFFLSRVSVSIYTWSNTFVLGLFTSNTMVGFYSIAEKLYTALHQLYTPLVNTLYPYVAHKKNIQLFKKIFKLSVVINIIIVILLFLFSDKIVELFFGAGLENSANVLKILSAAAIVVVPSVLLGYPFLAALGYAKYANKSVIYGAIVHIINLFMLYLFFSIDIYNIATIVIITETFVFLYRLYGVKMHNLWKIY